CLFVALIADGLEASAEACARDGDAEGGASAWFAVDADSPSVFLDDAVRNGESKPGALADALRRVERIVNLCHVLGRDTDSGVGDLGNQRTIFSRTGRNANRAAVGNRVSRVEEQVCKYLLQFARVAVRLGRALVVV